MDKPLILLKGASVLGIIKHYSKGWLFLPRVSGRKPGRKYHQTANKAIPRWAFDQSTELLTVEEYNTL